MGRERESEGDGEKREIKREKVSDSSFIFYCMLVQRCSNEIIKLLQIVCFL